MSEYVPVAILIFLLMFAYWSIIVLPDYSFVSNHAANHFGIATFFFLTAKPLLKRWAYSGFAWAGLIAYAQVYVGIHYPLDVIGGALLGLLFGMFTGTLFNKRYGFAIFDSQSTIST